MFDTPRIEVPREELREIALSNAEPVVRALAIAWLSATNDPAELATISKFRPTPDVFRWVQPAKVRIQPLDRCIPIVWVEGMTLAEVSFEAATRIAGTALRTQEDMVVWMKSAPLDSVEYWEAHAQDDDVLFARNPVLYLRMRSRAVPKNAWRAEGTPPAERIVTLW